MKSRMLSLVLALALLCALLPASTLSVSAFDESWTELGVCGEHLEYDYDMDHGILVISGYGPMSTFSAEEEVPWHPYRSDIVSVTFPEGMTDIGSYAFKDCVNLTEVNIPGSVTKLGGAAFAGCTGLRSVEIPAGVTEIPSGAFFSCTGLTSVSLPDGLETIKINAFYQCSNLSSINFPDGLTRIGVNAFGFCTSLRAVTFPESLRTIADSAFQGCSALNWLKLPTGVAAVNSGSFADCTKLVDLLILNPDCTLGSGIVSPSASLTIWGYEYSTAHDYADSNQIRFRNLKPITGECGAQGDNLLWSFDPVTGALTITGSGAMADYTGETPWIPYRHLITSISFPEGLTTIGSYAFDDTCGITSLTFPDSLVSIGSTAFNNCTGLRSVSFPEGLSEIGRNAFSGCISLDSLVLPDGLAVIGTSAFSGCKGLYHVSLPAALETISPFAFTQCSNLRSVVIPEHVTEIGEWAFSDCTNLFTVSFPEGLTTIGRYAFKGCQSLEPVLVPESVTLIEEFAFFDCTELQTLIILNASCSLEDFFAVCSNALTIWGHDDSTAHDYAVAHGIPFTSLDHLSGECGANGDNLLWTLDLSTGALTITGSGAMAEGTFPWFLFRDQVLSLSLPEGLTSIGAFAFTLCKNLTDIQLPDTVTSIDYSAFSACHSLTEISLPAGLTAIGGHAFYNCTGLTSVTIPDSVNSIGEGAFAFCTALTTAVLPEGCTCVEEGLFNHCAALRDLTLPTGLTAIGEASFTGCVSLTEISFPNTLTTIGEQAFKGSGLRSVSIPASVSSIGDLAFDIYETLNDVTVYNPNCEIGEGRFPFGNPFRTVLYGYQGSTLQACAEAFGYRFCPLDRFADVKPTAWYAVPVAWAYDNEITAGTGNGSFSPNKPCTREQIAAFIWKAYGAPEAGGTENPFTDVNPEKYYAPAVLWAYYHEPQITGGMNATTFGVGKPCTRAQVVTFLWAAAGKPEPTTTENPFTDVKATDYFCKAVLWAVENGVTSGVSPTTFAPKQTCTRAQVVTFLYKAVG